MDTRYCKYCNKDQPSDYFRKGRGRCKRCEFDYRNEHRIQNLVQTKAVAAKHRERNREYYKSRAKTYNRELRERAIAVIGDAECVRCGCNKFELLEINHKNGGGAKEMREQTKRRSKWYNNQMFYQDIVQSRRDVTDLEILCKPCNNIHYLELKYGPLPYDIKWINK